MIFPPYLQKGDTIGIVAPARKISHEAVAYAHRWFSEQSYQVRYGKNLFAEHCQYAGDDTQRLEDLQIMLDDPEIKAIICARGGYGTVRIIDLLDFSTFLQHPKWICGFSDITVLHSHIHTQLQIATLHSPMIINITPEHQEANKSLIHLLEGGKMNYTFAPHPLNRTGTAEGVLVGGNLSLLHTMAGTLSDISTAGKVLFIEDLEEYLYHIDRMMLNLKRTNKLRDLSGLIVGGMSNMNDNAIPYGKTAEEIIAEHCKDYHFPVCYGFPAGHIALNQSLKIGATVKLQVSPKECCLSELKTMSFFINFL